MKDFTIEHPAAYDDRSRYAPVADGIVQDLSDPDDDNHRITLSFTSEEGEGQYPLEDLLDDYLLYISDEVTDPPSEDEPGARITLEFAGRPDDVKKAAELVGKTVRSETFTKDGQEYVRLAIS